MRVLAQASRGTIAAFIALLACVVPSVGLGVWWAFLDPIAPNIVNEEATITDLTPNAKPGERGVFEVVRVITSDRSAPATIYSFLRRSQSERRSHDGRPVVADPMTFAIAAAPTWIEKGRHRRDRLWEVPGALPGGMWEYASQARFCNPLRCVDVHFDPMPVTFRANASPAP